jgi:hypothetical protein
VISFRLDGVEKVLETLDGMKEKIKHFEHVDIRHELGDWQVDDMNRKKPGTRKLPHGAYTIVRPRSRWELKKQRQAIRRHFLKTAVIRRPASNRPILRQVLIDKLQDRMTTLLRDKLHW